MISVRWGVLGGKEKYADGVGVRQHKKKSANSRPRSCDGISVTNWSG